MQQQWQQDSNNNRVRGTTGSVAGQGPTSQRSRDQGVWDSQGGGKGRIVVLSTTRAEALAVAGRLVATEETISEMAAQVASELARVAEVTTLGAPKAPTSMTTSGLRLFKAQLSRANCQPDLFTTKLKSKAYNRVLPLGGIGYNCN